MAIQVWGDRIRNRRLKLYTDNSALVEVLENQSSREPLVMVLVRHLVLLCLQHNIVLSTNHIPGKSNLLADKLSRGQVAQFRSLHSTAEASPTIIPPLPSSILPRQLIPSWLRP